MVNEAISCDLLSILIVILMMNHMKRKRDYRLNKSRHNTIIIIKMKILQLHFMINCYNYYYFIYLLADRGF